MLRSLRLVAALAIMAMPLTACVSPVEWLQAQIANGLPKVKTPINQEQAYLLGAAFAGLQKVAKTYGNLPRCPAGSAEGVVPVVALCSRATLVVTIGELDERAAIAVHALIAFAKNPDNYPTLDFGELLRTAKAAVAALKQIEGVK